MTPCRACGLPTSRQLCHFCSRTVELVKDDRCVSCTEPVHREDDARIEGLCAECRSRFVGHRGSALSTGTRAVLRLAANARYWSAA